MRKSILFVVAGLTAVLVLSDMAEAQRRRDEPGQSEPQGRTRREGRRRQGLDRPDGPPRGGLGGPGGRPDIMRLPVLAALDSDENGEISADEIANAVAALKKLDKNEDGKLTRDELQPNFDRDRRGAPGQGRAGGRDPQEFISRIMERDKDKDGKISEDEAPRQLQSIFARVDTDGDGYLTKEEINKAAERRGARAREGRGDREGRPRRDRPSRPE